MFLFVYRTTVAQQPEIMLSVQRTVVCQPHKHSGTTTQSRTPSPSKKAPQRGENPNQNPRPYGVVHSTKLLDSPSSILFAFLGGLLARQTYLGGVLIPRCLF